MLEELAAFGRPVFFVPGNHDPLFLFNQTASATEAGAGVHNAHGHTFELATGLRLLGWGQGNLRGRGRGRTGTGANGGWANGVPV